MHATHTQCCTCTRTCTHHMHATCTPDSAHLHARVHTHTRATNTILHTCLCTHTHTCHTHSQTCTCTCVYTPTHATHTQNCTLTVYTHMRKHAHTCTHKPALTRTCRHEYTGTHANRHGSGARPCHARVHTHAHTHMLAWEGTWHAEGSPRQQLPGPSGVAASSSPELAPPLATLTPHCHQGALVACCGSQVAPAPSPKPA